MNLKCITNWVAIAQPILLLLSLCRPVTADDCAIGVPRIEKGVWANKDSIYANCDKCYGGDLAQARECKGMYNRTAEDQIIEIEAQRRDALSKLPGMIRSALQSSYSPAEVCYFPKKYPGCQTSGDTLAAIAALGAGSLDTLPIRTLLKYQSFLQSLVERRRDLRMFQALLLVRPRKFSEREVTISLMGMTRYSRVADRIVDVNHWLYLFIGYSAFVKGCQEYEAFRQMAESNPLLFALFVSQEELGRYNRLVNAPVFTDVTYEALKKSIDACLKLDGEEEAIAYGNDYIYDCGVGNTMWALTRLYEKDVLGSVTDEEKKDATKRFLAHIPVDYIRPILLNMVRFKRHQRRQLPTGGLQTAETYTKLERIFHP
jgi:hypothetical protein